MCENRWCYSIGIRFNVYQIEKGVVNSLYGFSFYLNDDVDQFCDSYLSSMREVGFSGIFTSLHIPEEDASKYRQRLADLGVLARKYHFTLMVDVSSGALAKAGFNKNPIMELLAMGITGLRMDDGFSMETVAEFSHQLQIGLNASTITEEEIKQLHEFAANFSNLSAWHNYYPRPETGLEREWFARKNQWLKDNGLKVQAFISGDDEKRGPLKVGLPTLEEHRHRLPLAAALDLQQLGVDFVYIGDPSLSKRSQSQFQAWVKNKRILVFCENIKEIYRDIVLNVHHNRPDVARDVVRSREARGRVTNCVLPLQSLERKLGSITIDNYFYGRYMGELQLCKVDLPMDSRVNVIGNIVQKDLSLLPFIGANIEFELIEEEVKQ